MKIVNLKLQSKNLESQKAFYIDQLGFQLLTETEESLTLKAGATELTFEKSTDNFCYHFAFNIPSFQIREALAWLHTKNVEFIKYKDAYLIDFKAWNADAVYFYDADRNIVELIARKNMAIASNDPFTVNSILNVSEIGMPVLDVGAMHKQLMEDFKLKQYSGDQHYFCTMGDEEGLIIIVDQQSKKWMPTDLPAMPAPFKLELINGQERFNCEYENNQLLVNRTVK